MNELEPHGFTPPATDKADHVLDLLRAAGLRMPFGMDVDGASLLWATQLAPFGLDILEETVVTWVRADSHDFPSVGEFVTLAASLQRAANRERAERLGRDSPHPGQQCGECGEGGGWFTVIESEPGQPGTVRPCRTCRPEQHAKWREGKFMPKTVAGPRQTLLPDVGEGDPPPDWFKQQLAKLAQGQKAP